MQINKPCKVLEECSSMQKVALDNLLAVFELILQFQNEAFTGFEN